MNDKVIALVDCNNFFVSCERVFRPDLENKPVVVLSNNDGCIISRSNEAKALGIKMGEPLFKAIGNITQGRVTIRSCNFALYRDFSSRVMNTLRSFANIVEVYSIDEAFLELENTDFLLQEALKIKQTIKQWVGIPVCIGIAKTKTLAKLAAEKAKSSAQLQGVLHFNDASFLEHALANTVVGEVWGIGWKHSKRLNQLGIYTALDLKNINDRFLDKHFNVFVKKTVWELRGVPCFGVSKSENQKKSLIFSRSFGAPIEDLTTLKHSVASFTARAAEKLRSEKMLANILTVYVLTDRFKAREEGSDYSYSEVVSLPVATDSSVELIKFALQALTKIYQSGLKYKKAGVTFSGLVPVDQFQTNLFDSQNRDKLSRLMKTVDSLNLSMGVGTVKYVSEGLNPPLWKTKKDYRSPCYTTKWKELLEVNI